MKSDPEKGSDVISNISRRLVALLICLLLILFSRTDLDTAGLIVGVVAFSLLIFLELYLIRMTLIEVYAEALTENRFVSTILKGAVINTLVSAVLSLYLSANLIVFANSADLTELAILGLSGFDRSPVIRAMTNVGFPSIFIGRRSSYEAQALHRRTDHFDPQAA